jgi:hypothetical protein
LTTRREFFRGEFFSRSVFPEASELQRVHLILEFDSLPSALLDRQSYSRHMRRLMGGLILSVVVRISGRSIIVGMSHLSERRGAHRLV